AGAPQELQRAAGRWQAEWGTLTDLLRVVGGAASHARRMVTGLRVHADRMQINLELADESVRAAGPGYADGFVARALAARRAVRDGAAARCRPLPCPMCPTARPARRRCCWAARWAAPWRCGGRSCRRSPSTTGSSGTTTAGTAAHPCRPAPTPS